MIRGIDHLVIACADPDAAAAQLESALGIVAEGGGRHPGAGTWNRIAWLADGSYLELIGVDGADAARGHPVGAASLLALEEASGGLATFALAADDLERTVAVLRAAGSPMSEPRYGSRSRPDGETAEWWTAVPDAPLAPDAPPFLIQHAYQGAEWGADALAARAAFRHPIGSPVILSRLDIAVADPIGAAARLHEVLGLEVVAVADLAVCEIGRHVLRYVPRGQMPVPAVVTLGADIDVPRTVDLFGLRFDVERVELPVTSGTG